MILHCYITYSKNGGYINKEINKKHQSYSDTAISSGSDLRNRDFPTP
jgi:hypothetical protein